MRPALARALEFAARALERGGRRARLEPEALLAGARRRTGLSDFGDPAFELGLETLCASARDDAGLTPAGRLIFEQSVLRQLVNRLTWRHGRTMQRREFHTPLQPPIMVVGPPRSGTTFLHRLLALDPRHRGVPAYAVFFPFPWQKAAARRRRARANLALIAAAAPDLATKHEMHPDAAEECTLVMAQSFESAAWWGIGPVYGYMEWLRAQDATRAYDEYASFLPLFQSADRERRLVLKSPLHVGHIDQLQRIAPRAVLIQTHRDPAAVVSSLTSLALSFHRLVSEPDPSRLARFHLGLQAEVMRRNLAQRAAHPGRVCDVFYPDLVADPAGTLRAVYEQIGLDWPAGMDARIYAYRRRDRHELRARHRHSANEFGIDTAQVRRAFADYLDMVGTRL